MLAQQLMLVIDWLRLDWFTISAWFFGVLLVFYIIVKLNNYFYRWDKSPPAFLQPFSVNSSVRNENGIKESKFLVNNPGNKSLPVEVWCIHRCPRFLRNIIWGLGLHVASACIYELNRINFETRLPPFLKEQKCVIFYGKAFAIWNQMQGDYREKITIFINPPLNLALWINVPTQNTFIILGSTMNSEVVKALEKNGYSIKKISGNPPFRGYELALLSEVLNILEKKESALI